MKSLVLGIREEIQSNVTLLASPASMECVCPNNSDLKECNYMGLSDCSSVDSSVPSFSDEIKSNLNLKAAELRLGLPGSQSPERYSDICIRSSAQFKEKPLFPLHPSNDDHHSTSTAAVLGNKRGFSDAMNEGRFLTNSDVSTVSSLRPSANLGLKPSSILENLGAQPAKAKEATITNVALERPSVVNKTLHDLNLSANTNSSAPATKAQVVGWPPIRSFMKNSLATSKNIGEADQKAGPSALFVKFSMDGAPYLRKVDLRNYFAYQELSSALEKMFSCFTIGKCGTQGREMLNETKLKDLLHGSEYVLTYEDKDGDWMLVGDVPWAMFADTCRRMRIMKSSDAIGLTPRAVEKIKNGN